MTDVSQLPAKRKAAILLLKLGAEDSGPLLKALRRPELSTAVDEVSRLGRVGSDLAEAVVEEFVREVEADNLQPGDQERAFEYLEATFGRRVAQQVIAELNGTPIHIPFDFLDLLESKTVAEALGTEHPQTIALILSYLSPETAAEILEHLPPDLTVQIGVRLGTMGKVTADALLAVERAVRVRCTTALDAKHEEPTGGVDSLVELLMAADKDLEEKMMEGLASKAADLAAEVRAKLFTFDDIELIEDRQMQMVLRNVDASRLPLALKGVSEIVRDKFLNNLSSRAKENLLDEFELLGSVRMSDVEEAQTEILETIRTLEESGDLVINRGGGDFVG